MSGHVGRNTHAFTNAIKKHGEKAFSILLVRADAASFSELQDQEVAEIEARDSIRLGYNSAAGGSLGTPKRVEVDGRTFSSRVQAAEFYGIDPTVFNLRLERLKWTPEEAAGLVEKAWRGKAAPVVAFGVEYKSFNAACIAHGVKTSVARHLWTTKKVPIEESLERAKSAVK